MKKIYVAPAMETTVFQPESLMISGSLTKNSENPGNVQLSDKKGWDSNMWSSMEEEN